MALRVGIVAVSMVLRPAIARVSARAAIAPSCRLQLNGSMANAQVKTRSDDQRFFFVQCLWMADLPDRDEKMDVLAVGGSDQLREFVGTNRAGRVPDFLVIAPQPAVLDVLWASFFATGEDRYVHRVIQILLADETDPITRGAAERSLSSNVAQHRRVRELCERTRDGMSAPHRSVLDRVLARAATEQVPPFMPAQ